MSLGDKPTNRRGARFLLYATPSTRAPYPIKLNSLIKGIKATYDSIMLCASVMLITGTEKHDEKKILGTEIFLLICL